MRVRLYLNIFSILIASPCFALTATEECQSIKKNNPGLGMIYDAHLTAKESAEVILSNLDKPNNGEFIAFHFGVINVATGFENLLFRIRETPIRTLPADREKIISILSSTRSQQWRSAIRCYRGFWNCTEDKGDKVKLRATMQDIIRTSNDIVESASVKQCYLKDTSSENIAKPTNADLTPDKASTAE